ncbi:MAG: hypothetical protein ACLFSQ_01635 [Candidatus Zixiibacteriota bacterium]
MLNNKNECQDISLRIRPGNIYIDKSKLKSKLENASDNAMFRIVILLRLKHQ